MIIAIDFDGTIVDDNFPEIGNLKDNVVDVLKRLKSNHKLILWTCRQNSDNKFKRDLLKEAVDFLLKNNIYFDKINDNINSTYNPRKVYANLYIDDRSLINIDWLKIERFINEKY